LANTLCTESETYRDDLIALAHGLGLRWFGGIACFSDHAHGHQVLNDRPEMWPIDESGARRPGMEWYIGLTPSFEDYAGSRLDLAERLVRAHDLDGFLLDFIRWPVHWELERRPDAAQPLQSSFDAAGPFSGGDRHPRPGDPGDGRYRPRRGRHFRPPGRLRPGFHSPPFDAWRLLVGSSPDFAGRRSPGCVRRGVPG
jgi:hypothetical protein